MSWIKEINKEENQLLKKIYEAAEQRTKEPTANVLKVHSIRPATLKAHMSLYETIMFGDGELSRAQREMIGVVVSKTNSCSYCATHHSEALYHVTQNRAKMEKVAQDYLTADLDKQDFEICKYAEKLTKTPFKMTEIDIDNLRNQGLSDEAIFDINQITAYFNYVNRIVHGLGVELENMEG